VFQETAMPCRHLFNATTHEDRSTGILPNVPNDDDDDDDESWGPIRPNAFSLTHSHFRGAYLVENMYLPTLLLLISLFLFLFVFLRRIMIAVLVMMAVRSAIYNRQMAEDTHGGLSCNVLAIRVLPSLIPLAVSPALNISQVSSNCCICWH